MAYADVLSVRTGEFQLFPCEVFADGDVFTDSAGITWTMVGSVPRSTRIEDGIEVVVYDVCHIIEPYDIFDDDGEWFATVYPDPDFTRTISDHEVVENDEHGRHYGKCDSECNTDHRDGEIGFVIIEDNGYYFVIKTQDGLERYVPATEEEQFAFLEKITRVCAECKWSSWQPVQVGCLKYCLICGRSELYEW